MFSATRISHRLSVVLLLAIVFGNPLVIANEVRQPPSTSPVSDKGQMPPNGEAAAAGGCPCVTAADCLGCPDDNACNCVTCAGGFCSFSCVEFGDTDCNSTHQLQDILCALSGYSTPGGCPNGDLQPCGGDGDVDFCDVLAATQGFAGADPCGCLPAGTPPICGSIDPSPPPGPIGNLSGLTNMLGPTPLVSCALSSPTALPGGSVTLETFVQTVNDLESYQIQIVITRLSGTGELTFICPDAVSVDIDRPDFVFSGAAPNPIVLGRCEVLRIGSGSLSGLFNVGTTPAYLSTYEFTVSNDATGCSVFSIEVLPGPTSSLATTNCVDIAFAVGPPCLLEIGGTGGCNGDVNGDMLINASDMLAEGNCLRCIGADLAGCDVNCDGEINFVDFGDAQCLQFLPPSQCCDLPHGACKGITSLGQNCLIIPEDFCESVLNGIYQGDGTQCAVDPFDVNDNDLRDGCEPQCLAPEDCLPIPAGLDPAACFCPLCTSTHVCYYQPREAGDSNCDCIPTNLDDLLCIIAGFANPNACPGGDIFDISNISICGPDDVINLDDILRVIDTFAGLGPCADTVCGAACPQGACCFGVSCTMNSRGNCDALGGTYKGDLSVCIPENPCP